MAILTLGPIIKNALEAAEELSKENIETDIYDMIWMKPLDKSLLQEVASKYPYIITIEDGVLAGGFGSAVNDYIKGIEYDPKIVNLGIPDEWVMHGSVSQLQAKCGYDKEGIKKTIKKLTGGQH